MNYNEVTNLKEAKVMKNIALLLGLLLAIGGAGNCDTGGNLLPSIGVVVAGLALMFLGIGKEV